MNRKQGIKRLKEVLSNLPKDTNLWPNSTMVIGECGCILQQAAGVECPIGYTIKRSHPPIIGKVLGLTDSESFTISLAYDIHNKERLIYLIGELK